MPIACRNTAVFKASEKRPRVHSLIGGTFRRAGLMKGVANVRQATMKDIAAVAKVSVMTVSRAFRDDASVSPETRSRIRKTAEKMGYVFDSVASNLRSQRSDFVAVTIPSISNANFADTVGALSRRLGEAGLQVLPGYSTMTFARRRV